LGYLLELLKLVLAIGAESKVTPDLGGLLWLQSTQS
jgi:hypothetical protein